MDPQEVSTKLWRKVAWFVSQAFGWLFLCLLLLASLIFAALAHLDLPVSRRAGADILEQFLQSTFKGTFKIGSFVHLERNGVTVEDFIVLDPSGRQVLNVDRVSVDVDMFDIVERILERHDKISIEIKRVRIDGSEVFLEQGSSIDEQGQPTQNLSIVDAFELVEDDGPSKGPSGRQVRVWFPHVALNEVFARVALDESVIEGKVKEARARLLVTDKGVSVDVNRFRLNATGLAGSDADAHGEVHVRAPGATWGTVEGRLGTIPFEQEFRFENGLLDVKGRFPEVRPASVRPVIGSWPLDRTVSIANHLRGSPSKFTAVVEVRHPSDAQTDTPPVRISGMVTTSPQIEVDVDVTTHELSLNRLLSSAPESNLDSESKVLVKIEGDRPTVDVESKIQPGLVEGQPTPAADIVASWVPDRFVADGRLTEEGVDAKVHAEQNGDDPVSFRMNLTRIDVGESPRLRAMLPGARGQLRGTVTGEVGKESVSVNADLSVGNVSYSGVDVNQGTIQLTSTIPLEEPANAKADIDVRLTDATVRGARFTKFEAKSRGSILQPHLEANATTAAGLRLDAKTRANFVTESFEGVEASVSGQGKPVEARAERISYANSRIAVDNFSLKSIGEIRGDVDWGAGGGSIDIVAEGLSVSRIFRSLGFPKNEFGGDLNANIDLDVGARSRGTVDVSITNGAFQGVDGVQFNAKAEIDDRNTKGTLSGEIAGLGKMSSRWNVTLGGHLLQEESYRRATGWVKTSLTSADLKNLAVLLGRDAGIRMLTGRVTADLRIDRTDPDIPPGIEAQVRTKNFGGAFITEGEEVLVTGIDVDAVVSTRAGRDEVEAAIRFEDANGTFVSTSGSIELPIGAWLNRLPESEELKRTVHSAPLDLVLVLPQRNLGRWPAFIPTPFERGTVSARMAITGSLDAPELGVVISGRRLDGSMSPFSDPVDVDFNGRYTASTGALRGGANLVGDGSRLGAVEFDLVLPPAHLLAPPEKGVPYFTGTASVQLDGTRLDSLRALKDLGVEGVMQGAVIIERRGWTPSIDAELNLRGLAFGEHHLGDALMEVKSNDRDLVARAEFNDDYGMLIATGEMGVEPNQIFATVAQRRSIFVTLESERYDAAVLLPAVSDVFDELSGSLTGKLRAVWTPPDDPDGQWSADLSGNMKMTDGTITPSALGLRLEEARMSVTAGREGEFNVVRLKNVGARAESKKHNLHADGILYFRNLDLVRGTFSVRPDNVPFKSDGAHVATVTGEATGRFEMRDDEMRLLLEIDDLTAVLPKSTDTDLISLDENSTIEVLQYSRQEEEAKEEGGTIIAVKVRLGDHVRVKSDAINLRLRGAPEIVLAEELQMGGAIQLVSGGSVNVMGRRFTVERGTVQFVTGDPTDPAVSATAAWKAPNGVVVRANLEGTAKNPILTWSSDPALPGGEAEIISLVLGGSSGTNAAGASGLTVAANEAIGQTGVVKGVEFYTTQEASTGEGRIASLNDTTEDSYTASVRISDELWLEGSYQRTGTGPNRASGVSGTLDWRFHPHWSLRTEIGSLGGGVDMVWQYRY